MKGVRELNRLRSEVASKCFDKFKNNTELDPSTLVSFLHGTSSAGRSFDDFDSNFRELILNEDIISFGSLFTHLNSEHLSQINEIADLKIDRIAHIPSDHDLPLPPQTDLVVQQTSLAAPQATTSAVDKFSLDISRLVLAFQLPKTFKDFRELGEEQKNAFYEIGIDGTSARKYKPSDCQKINLAIVKESLLTSSSINAIDLPQITFNALISRGVERDFAMEISRKMLDSIAEENRLVKGVARITHLAGKNGLSIDAIEENSAKGANPSFTAIVNGKKHYIKTCGDDPYLATNGLVDPNELLVYKIMEYTGFGPRTSFLFGRFSSVAGRSSISSGNFIMTEDLNQNGDNLFLDTEENNEELQAALRDNGFTVDLSAASALSDILSLTDTFGRNGRNYGLLTKADGSHTIKFVDHLPNANNGLFSLTSFDPAQYSPRDHLQKKSNQLSSEKYSAFKDMRSNRETFAKVLIERDVEKRLESLPQAIDCAIADVRTLIAECSENFVDNAESRLSGYCDKIQRNITTYSKTRSPSF